MNLLISAGEASGDKHGGRLLAALRRARPDLRAFGMGGERLEAAGLERVVASESLSVVGISEVISRRMHPVASGAAVVQSCARACSLVGKEPPHGFIAKSARPS